MSTRNYQEQAECEAFIQELEYKYPDIFKLIFHVPNEAQRSRGAYMRMKKIGVKSGVADYILLTRRCGYNALCMEYKTDKGQLSDNQKIWHMIIGAENNCVTTAYSVPQAIGIVTAYYDDDIERLNKWIKQK